jgi:ribosomal protein S18 acetylase RimI-like enzyme
MVYKVGKKQDLADILKLYKRLGHSDETTFSIKQADKIWKQIEKNNIKYFLAKENGKIIAYCHVCIIPNLTYNGKSIGHIENIITDGTGKSKKIAKKLMEKAINYAEENNCYKVVLRSGLEREEAHLFYNKLGFNGKTKITYELRF